MIQNLIPRTIRGNIFMVVIAVLIPFLIILTAMGYGLYRQQLNREYKAEIEEARAIGLAFETFIKDIYRQEESLGLAMTAMGVFSGKKPNHLLAESVNEYESVGAFSFISPQGWIVASSDPRAIGLDVSDRLYLHRAILSEKSVSDLVRSKVDGRNIIAVARSIRDSLGVLQGVVQATIFPEVLPQELNVKRIGGGRAGIFDSRGQMVFSADPRFREAGGIDWSGSDSLLGKALKGVEAKGVIFSPIDGSRLIAARVPIKSISWAASATRPFQEVIGDIMITLRMAAAGVLLVFLIAILITLVLTRKITEPITQLERRALTISTGGPTGDDPIRGTRELISLRTAFDNMATQLKSINAELEQRVKGRTAQFHASNELLLKEIRERRRRELELHGMFRYVRTLLEACPDPLVTINHEGKIMDLNTAAENALGLDRTHVIGTDFSEYFLEPQKAHEAYRLVLKQGLVKDIPLTLRQASGTQMNVLYNAGVYKDDEGEIQGVCAAVRDITEIQKLENRLRKAEQMKLLGQLTSGVAHEVRNPLNAIMAVTEALFQEIGDNPEFKPYTLHIRSQVERLSILMTDLLELGKPINESRLTRVNIASILSEVIMAWQYSPLRNKCVIHRFQPSAAKQWFIMADSQKIQQALYNLLENACQHNPDGGEIHFFISSPHDNHITLRIVDQGDGIPPRIAEQVFEPFFTTRKGGIGLGLSIVRHILALHHGEIFLKNNDPQPGLTAEIRLPLAPETVG